MCHIRLDSHEPVSETSYQGLRDRFPNAREKDLRFSMRLSTEVMYAATEMVIDNPQLDGDMINAEVAEMVVRYYDKFVEGEERYAATLTKRSSARADKAPSTRPVPAKKRKPRS